MIETADEVTIAPQSGMQEQAMASPADIVILGAGAGVGKSWALMAEVVRNFDTKDYYAAIFRRTAPEITNPGSLWDESFKLYPHFGATYRQEPLTWEFPRGAVVKFCHCQYEKDVLNYQGAQLAYLGVDQGERFTEYQIFYLISRLRTMCGIRPYARISCNPDPDSWIARFVAWWLDPDGFAIPERSGVIRWYLRIDDVVHWFDTAEDATAWGVEHDLPAEAVQPLSVTFIPGDIYDNKELLRKDPGYLAKLLALPYVEMMRLLKHNWKVRPAAGNVYNRADFKIVQAAPAKCRWVRYWDKAATKKKTEDANPKGARTAGVLMGRTVDGLVYIKDAIAGYWSSFERNTVIAQKARADDVDVTIYVEQEPGSGGKESAEISIKELAGFSVYADRVTGDKILRSGPLASQVKAGNVHLVAGDWNEEFLNELHNFPESTRKDLADAASGAYNKLAGGGYGLGVA